jgi:MFS transporter, DHA1 family, tetracycline resistance protein
METTFALWANSAFGWGPAEVGGIFLYVGLVLVATQGLLIGRLSKRFGEARLVIAGAAMIGLGLLCLPLALALWRLLIVNALLAFGMGLLNPSLTSLISQRADPGERGGVLGVSQSASSLARILGPAIAGPLFEVFGRDAPYLVGALIMAGVTALAMRVPRGKAATAAERDMLVS